VVETIKWQTRAEYVYLVAGQSLDAGLPIAYRLYAHSVCDTKALLQLRYAVSVAIEVLYAFALWLIGRWNAVAVVFEMQVWMCGGSVEVLPCSHVGHLFRHRAILSLPSTANNTRKNYMRVAEVWLDEYKGLFYEKIGSKLTVCFCVCIVFLSDK